MTNSESSNKCRVVAIPLPTPLTTIQCGGRGFLEYYAKHRLGRNPLDRASSNEQKSEEIVFEDDVEYLRSLDPKEWKNQDHYAVLGIKTLRYKACDDDIKKAYRQKVLKHHPDKRKALGEEVRSDDDYFTCITKAYEILGNPSKRRAYDSVDPEFDDGLPTPADIKKDGFYIVFSKYFDLNSRWSEKKNVPKFGNETTERALVEKFYAFWYNFESWREYSYQDEEEKDKGQDREERRWIEKQNKAVRAKKKKEEMARIRSLVDLAYNQDPRIAAFKLQDKEKKIAAKKAKQDAVQAKKAEEERAAAEAAAARASHEREERARVEAARLERDAYKKSLRRERRALRDLCRAHRHYAASPSEEAAHLAALDHICDTFADLALLQNFIKELEANGRDCFVKAMTDAEEKLEQERKLLFEVQKTDAQKVKKDAVLRGPVDWSTELTQLLIKAVNLFPAGTSQRWEVVANFINQHGSFSDERRFNSKDVLAKAKDLQSSDFSKSSLKKQANQEAFDLFEKEKKKIVNSVDENEISKNETVVVNGTSKMNGNVAKTEEKKIKEEIPWTKTEQELLEQAIKTFPASTPERWDKIAECIPNRSKKDCMKRFKELVDLVKAKKQAANMAK